VAVEDTWSTGAASCSSPRTWQTLQPELVSPPGRAQAISLGSVNQNLARAIGPAIGGVIVWRGAADPAHPATAAHWLTAGQQLSQGDTAG
jgi:predicted MFS family arabinose efflux permease